MTLCKTQLFWQQVRSVLGVVSFLSIFALLPSVMHSENAQAADRPAKKALYQSGQTDRYLLEGKWLYKRDKSDVGVKSAWYRNTSSRGWARTTVPNAWNVGDVSPASALGGVAWYRKDFALPSADMRYAWVLRFESVRNLATVWLNGKEIGTHRGGYIPFELRIPASALKRGGTNRLVVRVDNRMNDSDFPYGSPTNPRVVGWWNYGGILREVYLRRVDGIDIATALITPQLPCRTCKATINARLELVNSTGTTKRVTVTGTIGKAKFRFAKASLAPRGKTVLLGTAVIQNPKLWEPKTPSLYSANLQAKADSGGSSQYRALTGVRSLVVKNGRLLLNDRPVNLRGFGLHEDDLKVGAALDNARREKIVNAVSELGGLMMRSHYPLHPYINELASKKGILVWNEIPVYQQKESLLGTSEIRQRALASMQASMYANGSYPSVAAWSVGNEFPLVDAREGSDEQQGYFDFMANGIRQLDKTRPIAYAALWGPRTGCTPDVHRSIDLLGANFYYGWYPGSDGSSADRDNFSAVLDAFHNCFPNKALMVTEFGAEANRSGDPDEKGTFEFQAAFVRDSLAVLATKPWLNGALYWALQEFRIRPDWTGGNPRDPGPIHRKGLLTFDGRKKPAWDEARRGFQAVAQYPAP